MSKGVQIAGGATLIALILGWYAATNLDGGIAFTYYESLARVLTSTEADRGNPSRVHGYVAVASIYRDVAAKEVRFAVVNSPPHAGTGDATPPLAVVYRGLDTPDLFKDGAEVVLEGRLSRSGSEPVFVADKLFAKCPSKFEAKTADLASY
jgi:cytochrome c-type biogenesis protein CcmE